MKPDIFRTLHMSGSDLFWNRGILRTLSKINNEVFYSEPLSLAYLDFWYIQNLSIFWTQDIENTEKP